MLALHLLFCENFQLIGAFKNNLFHTFIEYLLSTVRGMEYSLVNKTEFGFGEGAYLDSLSIVTASGFSAVLSISHLLLSSPIFIMI